MRTKLLMVLLGTGILLPSLSGCIPAVGVGVGAGALIVDDRRTAGTYLTDEDIELRSSQRYSELGVKNAHVSFTSFNRRVLVTGQVPDQQIKGKVTEVARQHSDVREVINELAVAEATSLTTRTRDGYVTAKIKTQLLDDKRISANHVKVVTENGVVYLMGLLSREEGRAAAEIAAKTKGVERVVKIFEYTD